MLILVSERFELTAAKYDTPQEPVNISDSGKYYTIVEVQPTQQANNANVDYEEVSN